MNRQVSHGLGERTELTPATGSALKLSPVAPQRFDEYLLLARVGQGGMAEVFLGLSEGPTGFRKLVAIKRLHAHLEAEPEAVEMFIHEANLAARLQHPNIVHTQKAGCFEGRHFIAMEYLEGQPLSRVLRRVQAEDARLSPLVTVRLIAEVLEGLHHAHEARDFHGEPLGLIHRDISPHNLFVTFDGHVKLIDFGVARVGALASHTRTGLIKGKLSYMAPEQALGERLDRRADLWSVGITLRECLTGQRVFSGSSDVDVLRAAISEDLAPLGQVAPHLPAELCAIVDRCLQRDRRQRFSTALELKEALEAWSSSQDLGRTRATLAATMRALFHDVIEQRKQTLRTCLALVDQSKEAERVAIAASTAPVQPQPTPYTSLRPSRPLSLPLQTKATWKKVTLLSAVVLAALLALLGSEHPPTPSLARAGVANAPKAPSTDTVPAQPAAAIVRPAAPEPAELPAPMPPLAKAPDASEQPEPSSTKRSQRARRSAGATPSDSATKTVTATNTPSERAEPVGKGRLVLDSSPYAIVWLGGQRLGMTPLDVELTAETHLLTLRNPELGIETTYQVTIPAHGSVKQRVALD